MTVECTASALLYSGRPDPAWRLSEPQRAALVELWASLRPLTSAPRAAPALGYKGAVLVCSSGARFLAYGGAATLSDLQGVKERRADPERAFERAVLDTAPEGAVSVSF